MNPLTWLIVRLLHAVRRRHSWTYDNGVVCRFCSADIYAAG